MSKAKRVAVGTMARKSSSRFEVRSRLRKLTPVRLPPGRATLVTSPSPTGSLEIRKTIGISVVAALAANVIAGPPLAMITETRR
jgi:hypothetical protein